MVLTKLKDLNVKVVFICPDNSPKYTARKHMMLWLLETVGFSNIEHFKSENIPYPRGLVQATRDILKKYIDEPVLVLEDDIAYTGISTIDIPDGADAFYLGLSECAAHPVFQHHALELSKFEQTSSEHTVRILNMLSAHAILYLSRPYKEAVIEAMEYNLIRGYTNDVSIAHLQPSYNIYASKIPSFYQSRAFNPTHEFNINVEDQTNIQIVVHDGKCIPVRRYGGKTACVKYLHDLT